MSHIDSSSSSIRNRSKSLDSGKSRAAVQLPITGAFTQPIVYMYCLRYFGRIGT